MEDAPGFRPEYFEALSKVEAENFWFRSRNALILWSISKYFPQARSCLEIGCGTGFVASGIAHGFPLMRFMGSEILVAGLEFAAARAPHATFCQMDARDIPYKNEFDMVGAFDVLEHIKEDRQVLENIHSALRPMGGVLITVPQHKWLWSASDDQAHHVRRYEAKEITAKLTDAGFEILRSTSFVSLLLPAMVFSRLRKAKQETFDPLSEFRIGRFANRALEYVLSVERGIIEMGFDFPAGGSRLIIARRPA